MGCKTDDDDDDVDVSTAYVIGTWQKTDDGDNPDIYYIGYEGSGVYSMTEYTYGYVATAGRSKYTKSSSSWDTLSDGGIRIISATEGILYGYNDNHRGWIAYYYQLSESSNTATFTRCLTDGGGSSWQTKALAAENAWKTPVANSPALSLKRSNNYYGSAED